MIKSSERLSFKTELKKELLHNVFLASPSTKLLIFVCSRTMVMFPPNRLNYNECGINKHLS